MDPDLAPGYTLDEDWIRRLVILEWIATVSTAATDGRLPDFEGLFEDFGGEAETDHALQSDVEFLESRGWVRLHRTMGGFRSHSFQATPGGLEFRREVHQRRGNVVSRRTCARDAILRWLYEYKVRIGHPPTMDTFLNSTYSYFYGEQLSVSEIDQAGGWLFERGLIRGTRSSGHAMPLRPVITADGEDLVEAGRSVNDLVQGTSAAHPPLTFPMNITVTGDNNSVIAASPGATQTVSISQDHRRQVLLVADSLDQLSGMSGWTSEQAQELREAAGSLRAEAGSETPDVGLVRRLLLRAKAAVMAGVTTGLTSAVSEQVEQAIEALPGL